MGSLLTTLAVAALAAAQPAPVARHDLETLLARPVSPGTVALLLLYAGDERAAGRAIEALVHPDARVRAVAARLASVAPLDSAGPAIRRALDSETDRSAAAEQLRAAALLMPRGDDLSLVAAATSTSWPTSWPTPWASSEGRLHCRCSTRCARPASRSTPNPTSSLPPPARGERG